MTTAAAKASRSVPKPDVKAEQKPVSWETFQKKYLRREDRYKYEWVNGTVEKTPRSMNQLQTLIWRKLKNLLVQISTAKGAPLGELMQEVDTFFGPIHRRPDIAYFSEEQIAAIPKGNQEPQFVIEIISTTDQMTLVHRKMRDYRNAGIPVVWHIFPELQEVHVYRGEDMTICRGDKLCSADPVLPEFVIPAAEIFNFEPA